MSLGSSFVRFLIVGTFNTIAYYLIYALLIFFNFSYVFAVSVATIIAMFVSFKTFGKYVFKNNNKRLIIKFSMLTLANYLLTIVLIGTLKTQGLDEYLSGVISVAIVAISSFVVNKYFIFAKLIDNN